MEKIKVTKIEVAQRQIDQAILLLFDGGDPISIHTLVMASDRILRDLSEQTGSGQAWRIWKSMIRPSMEPELRKIMNKFANFFKHADRDPFDTSEEFNIEVNDSLIEWACRLYYDFAQGWTEPMKVFMFWRFLNFPSHFVTVTLQPEAQILLESLHEREMAGSREDQFRFCKDLLEVAGSH